MPRPRASCSHPMHGKEQDMIRTDPGAVLPAASAGLSLADATEACGFGGFSDRSVFGWDQPRLCGQR
ncbi:hypothetical protein OPKNFCMD_5684 [Methylobacterium crusticola]|uniref:Uncharacterized protein n=1 Tax=Methylobacterium crusticola TaxID=1697972 RepID=A0ABQ4R5F6_9HYPH|nr:hypothetical protein OPKNFCMD_5684 [Methylobacterium crusticola]